MENIIKKLNEKQFKFLITGCAGFIGSNLVEFLLSHNQIVIGIDDLSNGLIENIHEHMDNPNFEFVEMNICDTNNLADKMVGIDYVLHQAAWGSVPRSMIMPVFYAEQNVIGTVSVFEAARLSKVKKVVYASSSSVYGDEPNLPKKEGIEGNLLSPYALSKKIDEYYGEFYSRIYKLPTVGLRYFNVFGRKQNPNSQYSAVIPKFIKAILQNEPIQVNGDGNQSRDFTYIDNVIEANLKSCFSGDIANGKAYNIAFGGRVSLNELIDSLFITMNKKTSVSFGVDREGDIKHSNASIARAKTDLNYNPRFSFQDGLELTIKWYIDNL
ncbi:NAD-dependent epimerase/dehydratase family protein [Erysipelothrix inopinata]|uniref:NAD-dependent epimerase/dehydratase family protein n=1 Tax=Erysipelothrix inopinata TaxID=225084 RepID=A0A7G9RXE9_9FIRM|nr:NAD-dependent epimerase/dehydratase family protein [Erysipelothrix inopinata]QNN60274.1 NAD-dependent epimerase/dehydratase family protein [Erysipelothrix inopinata]